MLGHPRFRTALGLEDYPILLDHLQVLLLPKEPVQESPVRTLPSGEVSISQEVHERAVFIDRRGKTQNAQDTLRSKWEWNVKADPCRIPAIEFGPIEVHATLALSLYDETAVRAACAHIVFQDAAGERQGLPVQERSVHGISKIFENQNPVCSPLRF